MALTLNGSANTIGGLAVGGLPDGTIDTDALAANAVVTGKITDATIATADLSAGVNKVLSKAWCSYDGSTNSIRGSENISSVTDNATGDFTFNFSSDFANTNYAVASSGIGSSNGDNMAVSGVAGAGTYKNVGNFRVQCRYSGSTSNALTDITDVNVVVFH